MNTRLMMAAALSLVPGCGVLVSAVGALSCPANYRDDRYEQARFTNYPVPTTHKSKRGFAIGPGVDGDKVDAVADSLARCLGVPVHACGLHAVMVAPDWTLAPGQPLGGTQVFPCVNGPDGRYGLCTGINQWPATVIVTPDMAALRHELIHAITHQDHGGDAFVRCEHE